MLLEIQIAVSFLTSYLYNKLPRRRVDLFSVELAKQLKEKFEGHWYPSRPSKGSGFRCLLIGEELDPVLMNAANDSGLSLEEIRSSLPEKLNMWIDPDEVSYRIGKPLYKICVFDICCCRILSKRHCFDGILLCLFRKTNRFFIYVQREIFLPNMP
jgi:protein Tob/BTG